MNAQIHWERIYQTKAPSETSWFSPHLEVSRDWIGAACPDRSAAIIDVGGGESTLPDDLLGLGFRSITVLDLADSALKRSQNRMGVAAADVNWLAGDIRQVELPPSCFDLWHDRAVFHFFTDPEDRAIYRHQLQHALKPGGQVILATFGPAGPEKCSGLTVQRYDAEALQHELGSGFRLVKSSLIDHQTPFGTNQQFLCGHFILV
jgi:2-polyprenyl-3-methyl-5-hydroxy-6-metoxy-1,4-benzoquinol methylase